MPQTPENKDYIALLSGETATVLDAYAFPEKDDSKAQTETDMEREFIETLESQSYEYAQHIKTQEDLKANLRKQLERLNEIKFSDNEWNTLWKTHISNPSEEMKAKIKKMQVDGYIVSLEMDSGESKNIAFLDKKSIHRNFLQVINQYRAPKTAWMRGHRYDVTILVNGFPMIHVELKKNTKLQEAFRQIDRYSERFSDGYGLFEYVQIFVISNGVETKYYSSTTRDVHLTEKTKKGEVGSFQFTSYWTDAENTKIGHLYHFTRTFFAHNTILKILLRYSVFDVKGNLKIMRPYQIVAAEQILLTVLTTLNQKKPSRAGTKDAGGYIWHTTGSGKTLTSFKTATLVSDFPSVHKVLFVVDRKDLDSQTIEEFNNFQANAVSHNTSTTELTRTLENTDPDRKIVVTTIQKLDHFLKKNASHPLYGEHVVIIFDECHRSQFGNMHQNITKKFKKYHIFGFTGTPIFGKNAKPEQKASRKERGKDFIENKITPYRFSTTDQLFGRRLHTYTITDAIRDGNVLPFRMETSKTIEKKQHIADKEVIQIDRESALTDWQRLESIGQYILDNFHTKTNRNEKNHTQENRMNALFAVESIEAAKLYYKTFQKLQAQKEASERLKIGIIYSYAPKSYEMDSTLEEEMVEDAEHLAPEDRKFLVQAIDDYNALFGTRFHIERFDNYYSDVCKRLKEVDLDLVIVVNMLLTGFDAPRLNTLFVDKNLEYHGLIQAFSRTNRLFNASKDAGNIVCFRSHLEKKAQEAIEIFGNKDAKGVVIAAPFQETWEKYQEMVQELKQQFPHMQVGTLSWEETEAFVKLFSQILTTNNFLRGYTEFAGKDPLKVWEKENYVGKYLTLADEYQEMKKLDEQKENINDDLVFEVELIKQYDIDVNFILETIGQSDFSTTFAAKIKEQLGASPRLRSKTELIEEFIESLRSKNVPPELLPEEWDIFTRTRYTDTMSQLIEKEALKETETYEYLKRALENDVFQEHGTGISELFMQHTADDFFATPDNDRSLTLKEKLRKIFEYFRDILMRKPGE